MKSKGYKILSYFSFRDEKMTFDILLKKRETRERLTHIATKLHSEFKGVNYKRVFISYYLCKLDVGHGAWATSNYNPILNVKVWGKDKEKYEQAKRRRDEGSIDY